MIAVKIDLWPMGDASKARELGRMYIANDGKRSRTDPKFGDYRVAVCRKGSTEVPQEIFGQYHDRYPKATRHGEVKAYPRLAYNVWRLIARAALAAFPEERKPSKTTQPVLDESVMRGLAKFAHDKLAALGPQPGKAVEEVLTPDEVAAFEWLAAGTADKDD